MKKIFKKILKKIDTKFRYEYQLYLQRKFRPYGGGVLVFHEVLDDITEAISPDYAISTKEFKSFINELSENKLCFGSFGSQIEEDKIYITFDDGYECNMEVAIPFLEEKGIEYIVFVPTDYIGLEGYVTKERLLDLSNYRHSLIGGHSKSHCAMLECNDEKLVNEIYDSKKELEEILNKSIEFFAFPYGSLVAVGKKGIKIAKEAGYKYAFSTLCIENKMYNNRWFYPRITVTSSNYLEVIEMMRKRKGI